MRAFIIASHRYAGIAIGLILSLIGISGSLLVFDHTLDEFLAPATVPPYATARAGRVPLQLVLEQAQAAVAHTAIATRIDIVRQPGSPHVVRFDTRDGSDAPLEVSVAPDSAEVLAVRRWGDYAMSWLYTLHYTLLAGSTGKNVVGVAGLFLLFFSLSGLYLAWPRRRKWVRVLSVRLNGNTFRRNFDIHRVVGLYLLPISLVTALSGAGLIFYSQVSWLTGAFLPIQERPAPMSVVPVSHDPEGRRVISVDQAVKRGQEVVPDGILKRVFLPASPTGSYQLSMNMPGEPWSAYGASSVWVDQYSGEVLATWVAPKLPAGNTVLIWLFPLHNGDALGLPGRWLVCISGWAPALLFGTGVFMWWRKRQLRQKKR